MPFREPTSIGINTPLRLAGELAWWQWASGTRGTKTRTADFSWPCPPHAARSQCAGAQQIARISPDPCLLHAVLERACNVLLRAHRNRGAPLPSNKQ